MKIKWKHLGVTDYPSITYYEGTLRHILYNYFPGNHIRGKLTICRFICSVAKLQVLDLCFNFFKCKHGLNYIKIMPFYS